jgi:hypothetical protein
MPRAAATRFAAEYAGTDTEYRGRNNQSFVVACRYTDLVSADNQRKLLPFPRYSAV